MLIFQYLNTAIGKTMTSSTPPDGNDTQEFEVTEADKPTPEGSVCKYKYSKGGFSLIVDQLAQKVNVNGAEAVGLKKMHAKVLEVLMLSLIHI